jgi:hypothetical protein
MRERFSCFKQSCLSEHCRRASEVVEPSSQCAEHFSGSTDAVRANVLQRLRYSFFDRQPRSTREPGRRRFQPQSRATAVARVPGALEQTAIGQPLKDPGHGARMQPDDLGKVARRDVRKLTDNAKDEALWSGDAKFTPHPLGHALEAVFDRPEQTHEVQNRIEAIVLGQSVAKRHERDDTPTLYCARRQGALCPLLYAAATTRCTGDGQLRTGVDSFPIYFELKL